MKVKLTCSISGPAGMFPAGSVLDTTDKEAASFIEHGYAVPYEEESEETEIETTESKDFLKRETAAKRINRRKK